MHGLQKLEYNLKRKMMKTLAISAILLILGSTLSCEQGAVPNFQGICITPQYIEGCNQYLNNLQCKTCNYRYQLISNGLCSLNTSPNQDCCLKRGSDGHCTTCQPGLYLINGKCQQSNIIGCLQKDKAGVCLNCATDYYLQNGKCSRAIKNCVAYTDNKKSVCNDCAADHSLISNMCVKNSILGCKTEENNACKQCYRPFLLSNGNCQIKHCKAYDEYKCVACDCAYYLTSDGQCNLMETGCVRYRREVCIDCLPKFRLKGSKCEIQGCLGLDGLSCTKCDTNYNLVKGACLMKNCLYWKDGSCETCQSGYHYKQGKCIKGTSTSIHTQ